MGSGLRWLIALILGWICLMEVLIKPRTIRRMGLWFVVSWIRQNEVETDRMRNMLKEEEM